LTGQSTAASYTFSGLTPGVAYTIAGNAVGAAGPSNWSNPASLIACELKAGSFRNQGAPRNFGALFLICAPLKIAQPFMAGVLAHGHH
jgi:hypothetical protein